MLPTRSFQCEAEKEGCAWELLRAANDSALMEQPSVQGKVLEVHSFSKPLSSLYHVLSEKLRIRKSKTPKKLWCLAESRSMTQLCYISLQQRFVYFHFLLKQHLDLLLSLSLQVPLWNRVYHQRCRPAISLCCLGWSETPGLEWFPLPWPPQCWNYRSRPHTCNQALEFVTPASQDFTYELAALCHPSSMDVQSLQLHSIPRLV